MYIRKLELKGYKRFALSENQSFTLEPEEKVLVIVGTNGSGKSSLMKELSPLPALHQEFEKGGYKYIEIEHNGCLYKLLSDFTGSPKYSFLKDDEELNPGHTVTGFKKLVELEFGLDPLLVNIMTGAASFLSMGLQDRKNWISRISDTDLTYAFRFYTVVKERLRDLKGILNQARSELLEETNNLLSAEEISAIQKENEQKKQLVEQYIERLQKVGQLYTDQGESDQDLHQIDQILKEINQIKREYPRAIKFYDDQAMEAQIEHYRSVYSKYSALVEENRKRLESYKQKLIELEEGGQYNVEELTETISALKEQMGSLMKSMKTQIPIDQAREMKSVYLSIHDDLMAILDRIDPDPEYQYTQEKYQDQQRQLNHDRQRLNYLDSQQLKVIEHIKLLEEKQQSDQVTCPRCQHSWVLGYDHSHHEELIKENQELANQITTLKKQIEEREAWLEKASEYLSQLKGISDIATSARLLKPLWDTYRETGCIRKDPNQAARLYLQIGEDIESAIKILQYQKDLDHAEMKLGIARTHQQQDIEKLKAEYDQLELEYHQNLQNQSRAAFKLDMYVGASKQRKRLRELSESLQRHIDRYYELAGNTILNQINQGYRNLINELKYQINSHETLISQQNLHKAMADKLTAQIKKHEAEMEELKVIEKALSPNKGLIARSLTGFINMFISQVNGLIKKVWSYPLELMPLEPDQDTFDIKYKFPVLVNRNIQVADISLLSSAQKEIVDLAIRIVSMKHLDMSHYPLYLDEFAASFDPDHRRSAFLMINTILTQSSFSQIFMINHYEHMYGALTSAQKIDLSPEQSISEAA